MLKQHQLPYRYREYTEDPLSEEEIRRALRLLDIKPRAILRRGDPAFKALGLSGDEPDDVLITSMAKHPTLLQRPIGIRGERARVGRPAEKLLELFSEVDA